MNVTSTRSRLLQALPPAELDQLLPEFERVDVCKGEVLICVGTSLEFAYFPEGGLSSDLVVTGEGRRVEVGCFGFESMLSVPEPSSLLLACGVGVALVSRRRRS